jgi:hypothetical protein
MVFVPKFLSVDAQKIVLLKILMNYETIMIYKKTIAHESFIHPKKKSTQ